MFGERKTYIDLIDHVRKQHFVLKKFDETENWSGSVLRRLKEFVDKYEGWTDWSDSEDEDSLREKQQVFVKVASSIEKEGWKFVPYKSITKLLLKRNLGNEKSETNNGFDIVNPNIGDIVLSLAIARNMDEFDLSIKDEKGKLILEYTKYKDM